MVSITDVHFLIRIQILVLERRPDSSTSLRPFHGARRIHNHSVYCRRYLPPNRPLVSFGSGPAFCPAEIRLAHAVFQLRRICGAHSLPDGLLSSKVCRNVHVHRSTCFYLLPVPLSRALRPLGLPGLLEKCVRVRLAYAA